MITKLTKERLQRPPRTKIIDINNYFRIVTKKQQHKERNCGLYTGEKKNSVEMFPEGYQMLDIADQTILNTFRELKEIYIKN